MTEQRRRKQIPDPPPVGAEYATFDEAAGFLRISRSAFNRLRAEDPLFPKASMVGKAAPRMAVEELRAWMRERPRGWSTRGGLRLNNLRRGAARPAAPAEETSTETVRS
jgi:hypothetical protein